MREPNWEHINEVFIQTFKKYEPIKIKHDSSVRSELIERLEGMCIPISSYLINAILNDPLFYDDLIGGNDFMLFTGTDEFVPLIDILAVSWRSNKLKIQSNNRAEIKTFLTGEDKKLFEKIIIDKINDLNSSWLCVFEDGWEKNPVEAKQYLQDYIKNALYQKKEIKGKVYLRLYSTIPWPNNFKETDKCILIYRVGLLLGIDSNLDDIELKEEYFYNDGETRQNIYHHVRSVIQTQMKREKKDSKKS